MKKIIIKIIPHTQQLYHTVGDYWLDQDLITQVRISETNEKFEFLILIHELIEAYLTKFKEITWKSIDDFDKEFIGKGEPGASKKAPYHKEHLFAENIERLICYELGIDWQDYEEEIENL